ncbi:MAG TPA: kynureninase [Puia sp.]|nr:kynureninase [Puia sp.]
MQELFEPTLTYAQRKDREDELQGFRSRFFMPSTREGREAIYFCGNSLGLQPRQAEEYIRQELKDWRELAIGGYLQARNPWMTYGQPLRGPLARIVGCLEEEVTVMNALTVNLHLLLLTFYRPTSTRHKILMEAGAFPSDQYAIETQVRFHHYDPQTSIVEIAPREGEKNIREEDILSAIEQQGKELSLVLLGGINYYTGQLFDMAAVTEAAHRVGALAGFDLAHAVGNAPLRLHDWGVDFAVWCSYKYLNGGPGAAGGAYIHERYARDKDLVRLGGWWGNDESSRFKMEKGFIPKPNAEGWSISTAQVFNMVSLKASLAIFEEAGIEKIQAKSRELTRYLQFLLESLPASSAAGRFRIITPGEPHRRGAQLSLFFEERSKEIHQKMIDAGIVVDYRQPGVVRVAPAPLYNSFEEVYRFYHILEQFQ